MSFKRIESSIQEAPVFRPTLAEWTELDPMQYIEEVVRPLAEKAGICKIIPPKGWDASVPVEKTKYKFPTRIQVTNHLEAKARVRSYFTETVRKLNFLHGRPLEKPTSRNNSDWYSLFKEVTKRGGSSQVTANGQWDDVKTAVSKDEFFSGMNVSKLTFVYNEVLGEVESLVTGKSQNRTPLTKISSRNTSSSTHSPAKKMKEDPNKSEGCANNLRESYFSMLESPMEIEEFIALCQTAPPPPSVSQTFWKYFPDTQECYFGRVIKQLPSKSWVVQYEKLHDVNERFIDEEESDDLALAIASGKTEAEARDAQLRGVCQCCNRAHNQESMLVCDECDCQFHDECLPENCRSYGGNLDWFCPMCLDRFLKPDAREMTAEDAEHDSALEALRENVRFSPCTIGAGIHELGEFGFADGDKCNQEEFIAKDSQFREEYVHKRGRDVFTSEQLTEEEFWRIARGDVQFPVSVNYGNDLDTSQIGSGFPTLERLQKRKRHFDRLSESERTALIQYASSPWNLNNFPTSKGSLLSLLGANISGVIVPWLYLGMTFSAFCFHVEDHNFASINYLHSGKPKSWWGVPASHADRFETVAQEVCPELFESRPDLLQLILTMFDPWEMSSKGVSMYHTVQRAGEFVVTFPRAYHGGFNHGVNCAEAVNFASKSWLPHGQQAIERLASLRRAPVVSHESMLLAIASWCVEERGSDEELMQTTAFHLLPAFMSALKAEKEARIRVANGKDRVFISVAPTQRENANGKELRYRMGRVQGLAGIYHGVPSCSVCKRFCSLSYAKLANGAITCLDHASENATLIQVHDMLELDALVGELARKARIPCVWAERALRLCWGVKQHDSALGDDCSGGPPLKCMQQGSECAIADTSIFGSSAKWKVKPRMEQVRKLLELPGADIVEEAGIWRGALERAELITERCKSLVDSCNRGKRVPIQELIDTNCSILACSLTLDCEALTQQIAELLADAVRFRREAIEFSKKNVPLAALSDLLRLSYEVRRKVDIPEFVPIERHIAMTQGAL